MVEPPAPALPPRPPLSRESTIRVDRDGHFWHEGARVSHPGLERAFAQWLAIDEASGRYILRNAIDWCYVTVDDAPLVVRALVETPDRSFQLSLSDGSQEALDPATLRIDEDDVPYCDVRGGALPARFGRDAAFTLLERVRVGDGGYLLAVGDRELVLRRVPRGAGARRA